MPPLARASTSGKRLISAIRGTPPSAASSQVPSSRPDVPNDATAQPAMGRPAAAEAGLNRQVGVVLPRGGVFRVFSAAGLPTGESRQDSRAALGPSPEPPEP